MQIFEFVVIVSSLLCQLLQVYSAASDKSSTMSELHTISSNTEYVHMESMMTRDTIQRNIHIKPHPDSMHELTFAIKQNNADKLHDLLMERSTPGQPLYQQWMSNDEVRALTANPEASNALLNWFSDNGIMVDWVNRGQEYFRVRTRIGIWERLLRATFHEFQEEMNGDNVKATRAESYSLPASIAVHVEYVFGIVDLPVKIHKVGRYASDFDTWRNQKALSTDTETIVGATQFDTSLSFTGTTGATSTHNIHTKAIISGITFVQVNQFGSSNCATNTVFQSFDFAVGRCIPISIASGVSSIFINVTKSAIFLNTFSDSFCEVAVGSPQQLPSNGVCAPFNGQLSTIIASNGTKPPQPPFGRRNNINFIKAHTGECDGPFLALIFSINNANTFPCQNLQCSASNSAALHFTAPVNCSSQCLSDPTIGASTNPLTLASQYGISISGQSNPSNATQSVFGSLDEYVSLPDLATFQVNFGLSSKKISVHSGHSLNVPCSGNRSCFEASLDVQYITAMSPNSETTYWYVDTNVSSIYLTYLIELLELTEPPMVNSMSYGIVEQIASNSLKDAFSQEAIKLGLMGSTILVSTGDNGVSDSGSCDASKPISFLNCACNASSSVTFPNETQTGNTWSGSGYFPGFPASCPYVTAVGATFKQGVNETSSSVDLGASITAGGGFSSYYARPSWQNAAVAGYFKHVTDKLIPTPVSGFNNLGRSIPDVALNGQSFNVVLNSFSSSESGTSASAPLFAAMISNVNAKRLSQGKGPVGFLNPTLYANANVFQDITLGNNRCPQNQECCKSGFYATTGWDPVTGLGSIQYANLEAILLGSIATAGPSGAPTAGPSKKPTSSSSNNDNSLSGGAIAGIVIGAVVFAGLVVVAVLVLSGVLTTAPPAVVKNVSGVQMASAAPTAPASDGPMPVTDAAPIGVESVAENA